MTWPWPFPAPMTPYPSRSEVFLGYLDYFRSATVGKLVGLTGDQLRTSRLPSGWAPIELLKHLTAMERRWLEWGFAGRPVADPWEDHRDGRWYVGDDETLDDLVAALHAQAARSREVVETHDLDAVGRPGERWHGEEPATLERVLFHVLQEYARHLGHLDIVRELIDEAVGE